MRKLLLIVALVGLTAVVGVTEGSAFRTLIRLAGAAVAIVFAGIYVLLEKKKPNN